jgi:fucose 4-O-acetylase-like acetyltransferase
MAMPIRETTNERSATVDLAKGLAIILVVIGHYGPSDAPGWWKALHDVIYTFHMPVFFFVAGYTWHLRPQERYSTYLVRKIHRLLVPCVLVIALYACVKLIASSFIDLVHPLTRASLINGVIDPRNSALPFLWFLYALFAIYAAFPILRRLGLWAVWLSIPIGVTVYVGTSRHYLADISLGSFYFAAGICLAQGLDLRLDEHIPPRTAALAILGFALLTLISRLWKFGEGWHAQPRYLCLSLLGTTATMLTCQALLNARRSRSAGPARGIDWLEHLGRVSLGIYLYHTLFEGAARVAMTRMLWLSGLPFVVQAVPCVVAGVGLPVLMERLVLHRCELLEVLFLGETRNVRGARGDPANDAAIVGAGELSKATAK